MASIMRWSLGLTLTCLLAACSINSHFVPNPDKPHHTGSGFRNLYIEPDEKNIFQLYWAKYFGDDVWADYEAQRDRVPVIDRSNGLSAPQSDNARVTWLGHSTMLVQHNNINVLTDPIFSQRASPVSFAGPRRVTAPALNLEQLPRIDIVVISHNHYDHLDVHSARKIGNKPLWVVPLNYKSWFADIGIDNVVEFDWWDSIQRDGVEITATPSQHWTARGLFDRNEQLWAAWSIRINDFVFWFAGDTGYNDVQFKEIGERLGPFDLAIIPIGGYAPRWFMKDMHVNPEEAVEMHLDVRSRFSIGVHWGTFPLTAEPIDEPAKRLAMASERLTTSRFTSLAIGESVSIPFAAD